MPRQRSDCVSAPSLCKVASLAAAIAETNETTATAETVSGVHEEIAKY